MSDLTYSQVILDLDEQVDPWGCLLVTLRHQAEAVRRALEVKGQQPDWRTLRIAFEDVEHGYSDINTLALRMTINAKEATHG